MPTPEGGWNDFRTPQGKATKKLLLPGEFIIAVITCPQTDLHFNAPMKAGAEIRYTVVLRSDSYLDLCFTKDFKVNVGQCEKDLLRIFNMHNIGKGEQ